MRAEGHTAGRPRAILEKPGAAKHDAIVHGDVLNGTCQLAKASSLQSSLGGWRRVSVLDAREKRASPGFDSGLQLLHVLQMRFKAADAIGKWCLQRDQHCTCVWAEADTSTRNQRTRDLVATTLCTGLQLKSGGTRRCRANSRDSSLKPSSLPEAERICSKGHQSQALLKLRIDLVLARLIAYCVWLGE